MINKRKSIYLLIAIIILSVISAYYTSKLKFNYDFETYFPSNDEDLDYLLEFRKNYENDTDFLLIGIKNNEGIFNKEFLFPLESFISDLKALPDVIKVSSMANIRLPVIGPAGVIEVPLLHPGEPARYFQDSIFIYQNPAIKENLISSDGKTIAILVNNTQNIKKKQGDQLLLNIESAINKYPFEEVHVAGKIKASIVYVDKMQSELISFISASILLIGIFLYIAYRSAWGIIVPLITVIISIIWTLGIMSILGKDIDLLTSLLPPILFVVAMSDMTHLLSKYLEELRFGHRKYDALKVALKEVGLATFITAVTTSIGFLTLLNSNIKPIRDFGFYTSIGVFVAYTLAFTLLPAILVLMKEPRVARKSTESLFWHKSLHGILVWIFNNKFRILFSSVGITLLSLFLTMKIQVNSTILDDISERDPLKQSVVFFENNFGGIRPFEMTITLKDSADHILSYPVLQQMDVLERYLNEHYGVRNIVSPLSMVKLFNQSLNGGISEYNRLPTKDEYLRMGKKLKYLSGNKTFLSYVNKSGRQARISGKMKDVGSIIIAEKNQGLNSFFKESKNMLFDFRLTGSALLIDKNNSYLAKSLIEDLIFGIVSIAIIIGLLFRSVKMAILAVIPNLIPLLVIGGIMGLFDINLKASTSIIFSIAFGIAVDDSIHFLSRFKLELKEGKHFLYALKRTYISTGKAMVVTSLILISGFAALLLSTFEGTFYTGLLISLTLMVAVVADLILLPVLLILFYKPKASKVTG